MTVFDRRRERGVALAVALILLVVLTLLALSGIRLSTMELRIAVNDELRVQAFEEAQSLVDATIRDFANTPVLAPGVQLCARNETGCTNTQITLPSSIYGTATTSGTALGDGYVQVKINRIEPQSAEPPVGTGFSLPLFDAAYLRVEGRFDKTTLGRGAAQVNEGIAVVYGSAGDVFTGSKSSELDGS